MSNRLLAWMKGTNPGLRLSWRMFWAGLTIRVLYITLGHAYRIRLFADHFQFGWEMGRVGRALATGYGFSDPFMGHSGPTAWFPPLYPLLIGVVFKLFGVYTPLSAWVLLTVNSIFSAATAPAVYRIAERSFNRRVALWSGWLWALYPAAMQYATHWIWDMAVTTCLFTWVLALALQARGIGEPGDAREPLQTHQIAKLWATFGILWGLIALLNSSLLIFLPFCGLWMAWPERHKIMPALGHAALAALLCATCITPWIVRNYLVFHTFVPIRANFGAEFYASSLESNNGFPYGPSVAIYEATPDMQSYKTLGEVTFSRERAEMAKAIFRAHPGRFRDYTLKRIWFYWAGVPHPVEKSLLVELGRELNYCILSLGGLLGLALALHRHRPGALLFAAAFFFLPITYYLVTVQARFRAPLEPLIFVLTVYLFQSADRSRTWSWQSSSGPAISDPIINV
jgi:4-amino-4-deoxy-L-arabinose transferase-like glycosyltransferase